MLDSNVSCLILIKGNCRNCKDKENCRDTKQYKPRGETPSSLSSLEVALGQESKHVITVTTVKPKARVKPASILIWNPCMSVLRTLQHQQPPARNLPQLQNYSCNFPKPIQPRSPAEKLTPPRCLMKQAIGHPRIFLVPCSHARLH